MHTHQACFHMTTNVHVSDVKVFPPKCEVPPTVGVSVVHSVRCQCSQEMRRKILKNTPCLRRSLFKALKRLFFHKYELEVFCETLKSQKCNRSEFLHISRTKGYTHNFAAQGCFNWAIVPSFEFASGSSCPTSHLFSTE